MATPSSLPGLQNLLTFVRVVDAGSFAEAARRTGTTTSAMSKAIARFEHSHGVRLLHRTTHSLSLTDEGERLLEGARHLLREAEWREASLAEPGNSRRGSFAILPTLKRLSASGAALPGRSHRPRCGLR